ncbi:hypothetical protein [Paenibacillus ginsengihumi]|uniref:hypothetical protein n=1 Tax=Paenibacillus ginsengihumi TaxID=431596 RepID=UPI000368FC7B|nr:hypothetical protein [Paenibacillus ginsengihumi]
MKHPKRRWAAGSALLLSLFMLSACGSAGPSQADFDRLQERVAELERQLADKEKELGELKASVAAAIPAAGPGGSAAVGDNGPAGKGDGVLITFDQYKKLEIGMTYEEVTEIIGGHGTAMSEAAGIVVYSYNGKGDLGANAVLTFMNGKLTAKAQAGLK